VLYRNVSSGRLVTVRPCRVVSDDQRGLLLYLPSRSSVMVELAADGRHIRSMPFTEWVTLEHRLVESLWQGPPILKFFPPYADHSVWFFFGADNRFANWYVNLEERAQRWDDGAAAGVDAVDQDLDVVVNPDRSWRWKDEDEFTERLALPAHYWVRDEAAVREEGRRVIKVIEAGEFPFDGTWTDFTPPAGWSEPLALPPGWDRPAQLPE
jgi:predicted RNA-binding protein associated with RNAse of E/G family